MPKRVFSKYSLADVEAAIEAVERRKITQREASKHYGIPRETLQNRLHGKHAGKIDGQPVFTVEKETAFAIHCSMLSEWGFPLDFLDIRLMAKAYLDQMGRRENRFEVNVPNFYWVRSFLKRQHEHLTTRSCQNIARKRGDVSKENIEIYSNNLQISLDGVPPENIVNYDETNVCGDRGKKRIFRRGVKYSQTFL